MPSLREYERKRDRAKTPEPFGGARPGEAPIFVVQRHQARRLHYDVRLERDGVLASWAVPNGVPLRRGQRHLAVHVEDHPLGYASFEGEIPTGQYGAGSVEIWDRGTYELLEEKPDGGLTVRLHGERLRGVWTLVPARLSGDPKNWLLIRKSDEALAGRGERRYAPMLASVAEDVPGGEGWLYEVKWDGFRALAYVRGGAVELRSRNDKLLNDRFPSVVRALARATRTPECVLDGEVVAVDPDSGRATFSALQQAKPGTQLLYVAFDLLEVDGAPLVDLPLAERRARLEAVLDPSCAGVQHSESFEDGEALFEAARRHGWEGILAKRADSRYECGKRSRAWVKVKTTAVQEFVVAGWTKGEGRRAAGFGALVLGVREAGELRWVGNVGTGFSDAEIERLLGLLRPLARRDPPFATAPRMPRVRKGDVVWVEPRLVVEVEFAEWTHDGRLRAPRYVGLREDKPAEEVRREREPVPPVIRDRGRELRLANLDKVFFPADGITKGDLLSYYRAVAPVLLPHLRDRPFTMARWPEGIEGGRFFQKDAPPHMPEWIARVEVEVSTRERPPRRKRIQAPLVNDELALLWMVSMGCIDLNPWTSRVDRLDRPDFVLFDLDPAEGAGFRQVVEVALLVREALDLLGLASFPKTSGANGMHVLVPLVRRHGHDEARRFAAIVAGALARSHRGLVTTEWTKARRRGVLIDVNQNGEGKTIASVYSVRPRPGAPVSTPLRWDEIDDRLDPRELTMDVVLDRVARHGDLFAGVLTTKQTLGAALRRLE